MKFTLSSENFEMSITLEIFESDMNYPNNTIMEVIIQSNGFSAVTTMDINAKDLAVFARDLTKIYETLSGKAKIEEPYGTHMFISFVANHRGHIAIKGYLNKTDGLGNNQDLKFENDIDQTYLKEFSYSLYNALKAYL